MVYALNAIKIMYLKMISVTIFQVNPQVYTQVNITKINSACIIKMENVPNVYQVPLCPLKLNYVLLKIPIVSLSTINYRDAVYAGEDGKLKNMTKNVLENGDIFVKYLSISILF